jgi:hypothetical protein
VRGLHSRDIKQILEAFEGHPIFRSEVGLLLGNGDREQIKRIRDKLKGWGRNLYSE